jgi:16S rRNA (uracil1498-N3)-methyltransferase
MVKINETADMRFTVKLNGKKISIPSPESCPPLDSYVKAYKLALSKKNITIKILEKKSHFADATRDKKVSLYLSIIKKANFELAVEKCTEVGVSEIHPIISERSEKKDLNLERLNKIVKEASEQSGRFTLPQVFEIKSLEEAVSQVIKEGKECVAFDPSGEKRNLVSQKEVAIFIGPEGGWSLAELDLFKKNNFKIVVMGENILRAETAAIVAVWSQLK